MEKSEGKKLSIGFETKEEKVYVHGNTIDELMEGLSILKNGKIINKFVYRFSKLLTKEQFERLDVLMLEEDDTKEIFEYAMRRDGLSNVEEFERRLIKSEEFYDLISFYEKYEGKFFEKVEENIPNYEDARLIYTFSLLEKANLTKLKEGILKTNDGHFVTQFFIEHQEKQGIISREDIEKAEEIVIEESTKKVLWYTKNNILRFAKEIKGANIEKLEDAIIKTRSADNILKFATDVDGANIEKLENAIIEIGDARYIFEFATEIKGANIEKLRKAVVKTKDEHYIHGFKVEFGSNLGNSFKNMVSKWRKRK